MCFLLYPQYSNLVLLDVKFLVTKYDYQAKKKKKMNKQKSNKSAVKHETKLQRKHQQTFCCTLISSKPQSLNCRAFVAMSKTETYIKPVLSHPLYDWLIFSLQIIMWQFLWSEPL